MLILFWNAATSSGCLYLWVVRKETQFKLAQTETLSQGTEKGASGLAGSRGNNDVTQTQFLSIAWIFSWGIITGSSGPALPTYAWLFSVTQIPKLSLGGLVVSRCLSGTNHWGLEWPGLGHTPALVWRDGLGPLRVEERQFPKRERGPDVQTASYSWLKGIQLLCVRVMPLRVGRSRRCHEYSPKELGDQLVDRDTFVK